MASMGFLQSLSNNTGGIVAALAAIVLAHAIWKAFYNVFLHPLQAFPGPTLLGMSRIPYCWRLLRGTLPYDILDLHKKYGDVVRIAPDELAFSNATALKEIMGHQHGKEFRKLKSFYRPVDASPVNVVNAEREEHSILRRQLAHGFSEKSMREQEPVINVYIDLLIQRLHENCANGKALNLTAWYNWTTFDIIGDLAFGEPFGCLQNLKDHPYVHLIFQSARAGTIFITVGFYPLLNKFFWALMPKFVLARYIRQTELSREKLQRRMEPGNERSDLIEALLQKKDELNLSLDNLQSNANVFIIGGSETTATLLTGVTYLLLSSPSALEKLTKEVRSTFDKEQEITMASVNQLTYMLACLNEALRVYPPIPAGLPRLVPSKGHVILGRYVPGDTIVALHHWAMYHNEKHFTDPHSFTPERFLGDPRYANDEFEILQPFSVGPRNCLGRKMKIADFILTDSLAYAEMRMILARIIYNFDMSLVEESKGWMERQKIYSFWQKGQLYVRLTPVRK
ncbi:cytochrome P450 monooxygenase [Penicillium malachiteum]|uniref:cytochrome P450 monooxygenase n=1 Tax=Penicillium malachiteum TaxID=1324776 RepID=UPI002546A12C|nr:cytochrome P450 monooxygenase [Penicillium malachiteum]KAJ5726555.1 cytochrome P450 monooxygenase [Penicillium malachiteum]